MGALIIHFREPVNEDCEVCGKSPTGGTFIHCNTFVDLDPTASYAIKFEEHGATVFYMWPEIFTEPNYRYPENTIQPHMAIADGLSGWGNCMAGADVPENFGHGMVKIGKITGFLLPEELMKASESLEFEPTFEDLLNAICQEESECNPGEVGDWTEWYKIDFDPSVAGSSIIGNGPRLTEIKVEDDGYYRRDARAVGAYQITKIYVDDVNRILGEDRYTYADRWDKEKSRAITSIVIQHYGKGDIELMARSHRKPSDPYGEGMDEYWEKVKAELDK